MTSIYWYTPNSDKGIGNAFGYAHHNNKMREHTSKLMRINDVNSDYALQIVPADQFKPIKGKINIIFTMWENLTVPQSYIDNLKLADYVIVPCQFCKDIFQEYCKNEIYVCGEGIESVDYPFYQRKEPNYKNGERFRIYWAGAPNPRKGYQYALKLIPIIENNPNIELYIKTTMPKNSISDLQEQARQLLESGEEISDSMKAKLESYSSSKYVDKHMKYTKATEQVQVMGKHKNIFFDARRVPFVELKELYNKAHVFAFPSMGEGWGLMGCEAMATGCPVVAPQVTGIADYFDASVGYPIDYEIVTQHAKNYGNIECKTYAPIMEDFVKQIQEVISNYGEALKIGKRGSKRIHKHYIWEKKAQLLFYIIEKIEKQESLKCRLKTDIAH